MKKKLFSYVKAVAFSLGFSVAACEAQTVTTLVSGLAARPYSMTTDASGNLYEVDGTNNITKITPKGDTSIFVKFPNGQFGKIANDGQGNLLTEDSQRGIVFKVGLSGKVDTFLTWQKVPFYTLLTTDVLGNAYFQSFGKSIYKVTPTGDSSTYASLPGTILSTDAVFDNVGNLFVYTKDPTFKKSGVLYKIDAISKKTTFFDSIPLYSYGPTTDGANNLFFCNPILNSVVKIDPSGVSSNFITAGLNRPIAITYQSPYFYVANNDSSISKISISSQPTINTLDKAGLSSTSAASAYSLRLLSSQYTGNAISVRRSSDNLTKDIGFTALGDLDTLALKSFVGNSDGYVVTWYDQSGNSINVTQTSVSMQPKIVAAGNIERFAGKVSIYFDSTNLVNQLSGINSYPVQVNCVVGLSKPTHGGFVKVGGIQQVNNGVGLGVGNGTQNVFDSTGTQLTGVKEGPTWLPTNKTITPNSFHRLGLTVPVSGNSTLTLDGIDTSFNSMAPINPDSNLAIGGYSVMGHTRYPTHYSAEVIVFTSQLSVADKASLDNNQKVYYSNNVLDKASLTVSSKGAYSTRLLTSGYAGKALSVRRSSNNDTLDIGFTSNGDLDTTSLKSFVGNGSGYVQTWYDQSGKGNNVTQPNVAMQPIIVRAGSIIRYVGKVALYFDSTVLYSTKTFTAPTTEIHTVVGVDGPTHGAFVKVGGDTSGIGLGLGAVDYNADGINLFGLKEYVDWMPANTAIGTGKLQRIGLLVPSSGNSLLYYNGMNINLNNAKSPKTPYDTLFIGGYTEHDKGLPYPRYPKHYSSEIILFDNNLSSADQASLDSNQNVYYQPVALPITLENFAAQARDIAIKTDWQTASESNSAYFVVERSNDANNFQPIGRVTAQGSGSNNYQFTDFAPKEGISYYRLKMVDRDGSYAYSKIVSVSLSGTKQSTFTIAPNPAKNVVTVVGNHIASVTIANEAGKTVAVRYFNDATNPSFTVGELPKGIYYLQVRTLQGAITTLKMSKE